MNGAAKRLRPKFMTFANCLHRAVPHHVGDWYRLGHNEHTAAPMVGGISHHSFSIAFYLAIYKTWKRHVSGSCRRDI